jgi:hypothetical protein
MNAWLNYLLACTYKCLSGIVLVLVLTLTPVQAASCDPVLAPFPGSDLGYASHGNRCEGFYVANVSSESLEVVSVLHGTLLFDWKPDVVLQVSAPNFTQGTVNVRAVAIPLKTYYRMDGTVSPVQSMQWPIEDVVFPGQLTAQRLGVYGWVGSENDKTFVPLRVTQKDSSKSIPSKENTYLILRSSVDVDTVLWRYSTVEGNQCSRFVEWQEQNAAPVNAGWPVTITLPQLSAKKGVLCLEIAAKEKNNDEWLKLLIRIWRPSSP